MIDYNIVVKSASQLEEEMILAYLSKDDFSVLKARLNYLRLLEVCGWSEESFDKETLKRINNNW